MFKLTYLLLFLAVTSLLSCEKKIANPTKTTTTTPTPNPNSGKIFTIAGNGTQGYSGDGGQATVAELEGPWGIAVDGAGNIYVTDNERIRKINTSGIISTIAGNGAAGYFGDGGAATAGELYAPQGLSMDGSGNLYISDNMNQRIRKVSPAGVISTFAGNGFAGGGYSGDGGQATDAELSSPTGLAVDGSGNIYFADGGARIRKVNTSGTISTFAGGGPGPNNGDGGPATAAVMNPQGITFDGSGNLYIADYVNDRIRMVNTSGIISTIAGNGFAAPFDGGYSGDGGQATDAELNEPTDVKVDIAGNVYINDGSNEVIRLVNASGIITTIAGIGPFGSYGYSGDGGPATAAETGYSEGMAIDGSSNIYIGDLYVKRIRKVYK